MNISKLGRNEKQRDGVWVQFSPASDGAPAVEFKIAAARNKAFLDKANKLKKAYRKSDGTFKVPDSKTLPLFWQSMAGTVLMDWRGIQADGEPVPFNEEAFMAFSELDDLEVRAALDFIVVEADNESNFQTEESAARVAALKSAQPVVPLGG